MKRKNLLLNSKKEKNISSKFTFFSNNSIRENKTMNERNPIVFEKNLSTATGDHNGRIMMEGLKWMLEALIDRDIEAAKVIGRVFPHWYNEYSNMSLRELVEARLLENGWSVNEEEDKKYEEFLKTLDM
jgi:hypothetical protein